MMHVYPNIDVSYIYDVKNNFNWSKNIKKLWSYLLHAKYFLS